MKAHFLSATKYSSMIYIVHLWTNQVLICDLKSNKLSFLKCVIDIILPQYLSIGYSFYTQYGKWQANLALEYRMKQGKG